MTMSISDAASDFPDFTQECLMTTQQGYLFSKGITASTEVDVSDTVRMSMTVKHSEIYWMFLIILMHLCL